MEEKKLKNEPKQQVYLVKQSVPASGFVFESERGSLNVYSSSSEEFLQMLQVLLSFSEIQKLLGYEKKEED